ncbi:MAG: AgmX/PglI C-terminal domain-containing protein [Bradymonadaceae bacterium]
MSTEQQSLRVALIWNQNVYQERTFTQTSDPTVTVGDEEGSDFDVASPSFPDQLEMFERGDGGYVVRIPDTLEGTFAIGGDEQSLEELAESGQAVSVDTAYTDEGTADIYEVQLGMGDWGLLHFDERTDLYFQVMSQPVAVPGRGLASFDKTLAGMLALALLAHLAFLLVAFLAYDVNPALEQRKIPDRFVKIMVQKVEDPLKKKKKKDASEDTTAKKAGGEEGKFGNPDKKMPESKVPKVDGPKKKKIDVKNIGVNKMLASKNLGKGALKDIFGNQDGFNSKMKVAMSGEGSQLQVGRGAGGMGLRGTGSGGGGEGFGRVHGLGKVDTGGGQGTGAAIGTKKEKDVEPNVERGTPKIGDFCDRSDIRKTVQSKSAAIQYCYEKQLQLNPKLKGKVVAQWKVNLDGSVKSTSIASSTLNNRKVESCITRVIKRMRFQKPDGGICVINYPFVFSGID